MSEEEKLIKYLQSLDKTRIFYDNPPRDNYVEIGKAIQGLLDLYNKEKEKNKELIDGQISTLKKILLPELLKRFISKDKIRELLKQYAYTEIGDTDKIIEFYKKTQELLEENNEK